MSDQERATVEVDVLDLFESMEVFLTEEAFVSMVLSAAEVYKNECLGLLTGHTVPGRYMVERAVVYQTTRRRRNGVRLIGHKHKRISRLIENFEHLEAVGYFHSHPGWGDRNGVPKASDLDQESMNPWELHFICAINEGKKPVPWKRRKDGSIEGSLDQFHFRLAAFYLHINEGLKRKSVIKRAPIVCPFATGLGQK